MIRKFSCSHRTFTVNESNEIVEIHLKYNDAFVSSSVVDSSFKDEKIIKIIPYKQNQMTIYWKSTDSALRSRVYLKSTPKDPAQSLDLKEEIDVKDLALVRSKLYVLAKNGDLWEKNLLTSSEWTLTHANAKWARFSRMLSVGPFLLFYDGKDALFKVNTKNPAKTIKLMENLGPNADFIAYEPLGVIVRSTNFEDLKLKRVDDKENPTSLGPPTEAGIMLPDNRRLHYMGALHISKFPLENDLGLRPNLFDAVARYANATAAEKRVRLKLLNVIMQRKGKAQEKRDSAIDAAVSKIGNHPRWATEIKREADIAKPLLTGSSVLPPNLLNAIVQDKEATIQQKNAIATAVTKIFKTKYLDMYSVHSFVAKEAQGSMPIFRAVISELNNTDLAARARSTQIETGLLANVYGVIASSNHTAAGKGAIINKLTDVLATAPQNRTARIAALRRVTNDKELLEEIKFQVELGYPTRACPIKSAPVNISKPIQVNVLAILADLKTQALDSPRTDAEKRTERVWLKAQKYPPIKGVTIQQSDFYVSQKSVPTIILNVPKPSSMPNIEWFSSGLYRSLSNGVWRATSKTSGTFSKGCITRKIFYSSRN